MAESSLASEPAPELHPGLRAICDRYILDVANVRYLLELLEDRELDAAPEGGGWTARQTLVHLVISGHMHASFFDNLAKRFSRSKDGTPKTPPTGNEPQQAHHGEVEAGASA